MVWRETKVAGTEDMSIGDSFAQEVVGCGQDGASLGYATLSGSPVRSQSLLQFSGLIRDAVVNTC